MLKKGSKVHVIMRRQYEQDLRRHFIGEVIDSSEYLVVVEGYVFVFTMGVNEYLRKSDKRKRITSLIDSRNVVNILPGDVDIDKVHYCLDDKKMIVTDGKTFRMDVHEFGNYI
jgi:hypothetical protein